MGVYRVEFAVECDDPMTEGMDVLAGLMRTLGVAPEDVESDVEVILTSSEDGTPVLVAVIQKSDDGSDDHE